MGGPLVVSNLRRRWASTVVLVVLVAVSVGVTTAALVGARRTATAFPRLVDALGVADVGLLAGTADGHTTPGPASRAAIVDHDGVAVAGIGVGIGLMPRLPDGSPAFDLSLGTLVSDGVIGYDIDRPLLIAGRLPRRDAADEILLDEVAARQSDAAVGDPFPAVTFNVNAIAAKSAELEEEAREPSDADLAEIFTAVDLVVVGIGRPAAAILVNEAVAEDGQALLSPAFGAAHPSSASYTIGSVDLIDAGTAGAFVTDIRTALSGVDIDPREQVLASASFSAAVRPYWIALALFALVFGIGAVLAVGPLLLRVVDDDLADATALRALGATPHQLAVGGASRAVAVAVAGSVVSVPLAITLSSRFPFGPARRAEAISGVEVHVTGLAVAVGSVIVVATASALLRAHLVARVGRVRPRRRSASAAAAARLGLPASVTTAVHAAFEPGAPTPRRRLATAGAVGALVAALAALTFGNGLARLVDDPHRFGWGWDYLLEGFEDPVTDDQVADLVADPDVTAFASISRGNVTLDGRAVPAIGIEAGKATLEPVVLDGRAPMRPGEIGLGAVTMRDLDVRIGDEVTGSTVTGGRQALTVVGELVPGSVQLDESDQIGQGAVVAAGDWRTLVGSRPTAILVDVVAGTTPAVLGERYPQRPMAVQRPADILSYDGVRAVPFLLAGLLGALATVVLAHHLVGSVRARRRDLAVLRTLGFDRRQVTTSVVWQVMIPAVLGLAIAVPLGLAAGRLGWRAFAEGIGVASDVSTPLTLVASASVAILVVSGFAAMPSALRAANRLPAAALTGE